MDVIDTATCSAHRASGDVAGEVAGLLDSSPTLHPQVALRPEPFGALAYHYGNRKLIFLKHPDVVRVVRALDGSTTVAEAMTACDIDRARWPSFERALANLQASEMLT